MAKTCPTDFLHLETQMEPLKDRYDKNDDITWDRFARLPNNDSRYQLLANRVPTRLKTRLGWRAVTAQRMDNLVIARNLTTPPLAPWRKISSLTIDAVKLDKKKEEYTKYELLELTMQSVNSIECDIKIYTDGSTYENQENGGGRSVC